MVVGVRVISNSELCLMLGRELKELARTMLLRLISRILDTDPKFPIFDPEISPFLFP